MSYRYYFRKEPETILAESLQATEVARYLSPMIYPKTMQRVYGHIDREEQLTEEEIQKYELIPAKHEK